MQIYVHCLIWAAIGFALPIIWGVLGFIFFNAPISWWTVRSGILCIFRVRLEDWD
jgi:hypothetical protein